MKRGPYRRQPTMDRFWSKVDKNGPVPEHRPELGRCWIWTARKDTQGYGRFTARGNRSEALERRESELAHRFLWERLNGPMASGLEPDHLCRTKPCVRPDHLEAVTHQVNCDRAAKLGTSARKTECANGHAYTRENTYRTSAGHRACRACRAEWRRRYVERNAEQVKRQKQEYVERNPSQVRARHRDAQRAYVARRRAAAGAAT